MPIINIVKETEVSSSVRSRQLEAMFDVPRAEKSKLQWVGKLPIEDKQWSIGLIVGPSGSGKSTILKEVFGSAIKYDWREKSVIDDFEKTLSIESISSACQAVGFNTIPAWLRPYSVLSNGEKFRVELARLMLEELPLLICDEFTSVVDRQVAKIASHAVQKYVRKNRKQFVAASCHYDIIDWLQPDWIFEPSSMKFEWRLLRQRPQFEIYVQQVQYEAWKLFAPFHYMSGDLNKSAKCFGLYVDQQLVAFAGVLHRPHSKVHDIKGISRLVTLPDWQGLGLAPFLSDILGSAYKALKFRLHTYPAHPALIRSFDKSCKWVLTKKPGQFSSKQTLGGGLRACAVFEYCGDAMNQDDASKLLG